MKQAHHIAFYYFENQKQHVCHLPWAVKTFVRLRKMSQLVASEENIFTNKLFVANEFNRIFILENIFLQQMYCMYKVYCSWN